jgi:JmjC domain, hydroxylase
LFIYPEKELEEGEDGFTVEYASDLAIDQYVGMDDKKGEFSLRNIYKMEDSLFQIVQGKTESISGIVIPWAYVACKFSTFCWHTEDLFLYSFNYMHEGGCKIWYSISYDDIEKVRSMLLRKYASELKKRPTLIDDVLINFSPLQFVKEGVVCALL